MRAMKNITEEICQIKLEEERKVALQTIRFLDESTNDYLYLFDLINERVFFTDKICEKYAIPSSGEQGIAIDKWAQIIYSRDRWMLQKNLLRIKKGEIQTHNLEYRLTDREGRRVWINCKGRVQQDEDGNPLFLIGSVSEMARGRLVDNLTGLWNEDRFIEDLRGSLKKGTGYLLVLGIDNFKDINVKNGRTFGDHVLRKTADILEDHLDYPSKLYRLGSDRFAVIFPEKFGKEIVEFYYSVKEGMETYCTISAGAVSYHSSDGADCSMVYQYAESALDRAKKQGKNILEFFSAEDFQKSLDRIKLQDEIRQAAQNNCTGFYLCYQPQIDSSNFRIYGAEALLRYESPSRGVMGPMEFIPLLEQSGMICPVGTWVLQTAIHQCARWRKYISGFHINVNISYVQLKQKNIMETVLGVLREEGLPGDALTLEVTESMQLQDYSYFNRILYEWKRHGIKIAIDDFGTGYSSLSYLKSMDVDETKIDRCFINRIHYNTYNYRLLSNMIELAHSARIQVCCEGVETEEELRALRQLKPDIFQGFLFARPYKKEEFEKLYIDSESEEYQERLKKEKFWREMDSEKSGNSPESSYQEDLESVVESMDEVVYVSDLESCDLYYLNPAGRKLTGIYDYKGLKCYQVLCGRNTPCKYCKEVKLSEEGSAQWQMSGCAPGKQLRIRNKRIPWNGKTARLGIAGDVTQKSRFEEILPGTRLGLWKICIDEKTGKAELEADEVMTDILGLKNPISPEECYTYWYNRINEGYYRYVNLAIDSIIQSGKLVQVEYTWNHPEKGEMLVRSVGIRVEDQDGKICLQGYHRMISDLDRPYFLPGGLDCEMFEYNEKKHNIYFHTERKLISGEKKKEKDFPECWIREQIVHPHFAEAFREIFRNVYDKDNIHACEMLLAVKDGSYEWFRLKTRHLGQREKDMNTIVVLMEPAGQERAMELEYMRKSDFYEAILSETAAYAEVDVEGRQITVSGGLWEIYADKFRNKWDNLDHIIQNHIDQAVCREDRAEYRKYMDLENMKEMYKKGITNMNYSFRRYVDGELCWMELVIHVFLDKYTENMYALLYLKNIDAVKRKEIARENAAQRDPLTNVYNRSVFEQEVLFYMKNEGSKARGALIILDLDNFKKVNDQYGHLRGDETLKLLTKLLQSTFRSQDLIGRLGGDEFLVFVKNVTDRKILDKRMDDLFEKMKQASGYMLSCSVGISFARGEEFCYREVLEEADTALYWSKEKGKNQYSYFERK